MSDASEKRLRELAERFAFEWLKTRGSVHSIRDRLEDVVGAVLTEAHAMGVAESRALLVQAREVIDMDIEHGGNCSTASVVGCDCSAARSLAGTVIAALDVAIGGKRDA